MYPALSTALYAYSTWKRRPSQIVRVAVEGEYWREDAVVKVVACTDGSLLDQQWNSRIEEERTMVQGLGAYIPSKMIDDGSLNADAWRRAINLKIRSMYLRVFQEPHKHQAEDKLSSS